ncbi:phage NrS-1 polymerase family protein [Alkalihalobacterium elongatum]|uniref:phage NrS-1 polymerase family protein n=1 Tax=Alkalihalobacterium elongatum TaxID=2675466 RepID=UPI001C1F7EAB|nr:hypothetical protein [Alkalihalobacterium elongatum]
MKYLDKTTFELEVEVNKGYNFNYSFSKIPAELKMLRQWVLWKLEERNGKLTKVPYMITGSKAKPNDPNTWSTFEETLGVYQKGDYTGLGFMFSVSDPYCGIDIDKCYSNEEFSQLSVDLRNLFRSYTEFSPSKTGMHIIVKGKLNIEGTGKKNPKLGLEIYDKGRFFTFTGWCFGEEENIVSCQGEIGEFMERYILKKSVSLQQPDNFPKEAKSNGVDQEIWENMFSSTSGDKINRLYNGQISDYKYDHSSADLALCSYLSMYTNNDKQRMDRMFRQTLLYRPKWDEFRGNQTYGELTINKAVGESSFQQVPQQNAKKEKMSQAEKLVEIAQQAEYFVTPEGNTYAKFSVNNHFENCDVESKRFNQWLRLKYSEETKRIPSKQAIQDAINQLVAVASFGFSSKKPVHVRIAGDFNKIYVDLANDLWQAVEITADGWRIIDNPPVNFKRVQGLQKPLPYPVSGGDVKEIKDFVNVTDDEWPLFISYVVSCFHPEGPYPLLVFQGGQGSAKSTHSRIVKSLIDPSEAMLRSLPKDEKGIALAANNNWCPAFDNLSGLSSSLSDALCRLSTGGSLADKKLYTDDIEQIFTMKRPVILNGIDDIAERGDLADRAVVINLPRILKEDRRAESELWNNFADAQPRILGALFDCISSALRNLPHVQLKENPRMIDFARWATAAEESCGLQPGEFMKSYSQNQEKNAYTSIENDEIALGIYKLMKSNQHKEWVGNSEKLLTILASRNPGVRRWPHSTRLKSRIVRVTPLLKVFGIEIERCRNRMYRITMLRGEGNK